MIQLLMNPSSSFIDMTSNPLRKEGLKLLAYSKDIIKSRVYKPWPEDTISSLFKGIPTNDTEVFALKVNGLYSTGMAALFFHKLGHIYLDHSEEASLQEELKKRIRERTKNES